MPELTSKVKHNPGTHRKQRLRKHLKGLKGSPLAKALRDKHGR